MPPLTPDELRQWMSDYHWSVRRLAQELDVASTTVQRYRDGTLRIPTVVELALRELQRREGPLE